MYKCLNWFMNIYIKFMGVCKEIRLNVSFYRLTERTLEFLQCTATYLFVLLLNIGVMKEYRYYTIQVSIWIVPFIVLEWCNDSGGWLWETPICLLVLGDIPSRSFLRGYPRTYLSDPGHLNIKTRKSHC